MNLGERRCEDTLSNVNELLRKSDHGTNENAMQNCCISLTAADQQIFENAGEMVDTAVEVLVSEHREVDGEDGRQVGEVERVETPEILNSAPAPEAVASSDVELPHRRRLVVEHDRPQRKVAVSFWAPLCFAAVLLSCSGTAAAKTFHLCGGEIQVPHSEMLALHNVRSVARLMRTCELRKVPYSPGFWTAEKVSVRNINSCQCSGGTLSEIVRNSSVSPVRSDVSPEILDRNLRSFVMTVDLLSSWLTNFVSNSADFEKAPPFVNSAFRIAFDKISDILWKILGRFVSSISCAVESQLSQPTELFCSMLAWLCICTALKICHSQPKYLFPISPVLARLSSDGRRTMMMTAEIACTIIEALFDTGCTRTTISRGLAKSLGLTVLPLNTQQLSIYLGDNSAVKILGCTMFDLTIDGKSFKNVVANVADLPDKLILGTDFHTRLAPFQVYLEPDGSGYIRTSKGARLSFGTYSRDATKARVAEYYQIPPQATQVIGLRVDPTLRPGDLVEFAPNSRKMAQFGLVLDPEILPVQTDELRPYAYIAVVVANPSHFLVKEVEVGWALGLVRRLKAAEEPALLARCPPDIAEDDVELDEQTLGLLFEEAIAEKAQETEVSSTGPIRSTWQSKRCRAQGHHLRRQKKIDTSRDYGQLLQDHRQPRGRRRRSPGPSRASLYCPSGTHDIGTKSQDQRDHWKLLLEDDSPSRSRRTITS